MTTIHLQQMTPSTSGEELAPAIDCDDHDCDNESCWRIEVGTSVRFLCTFHTQKWMQFTLKEAEKDLICD